MNNGARPLDVFLNFLKTPGSGIDQAFISKINNDPTMMAFYMNALAAGNYRTDDIYRDIKRRELVEKGDESLKYVQVISPTVNADEFKVTDQGRLATTLPSITPPAQIGNISQDVWGSTAAMLNDNYYKLLDPESYDPNSTAFKDSLSKIKSEMHDYILRALESGNEKDKAIADSEWSKYKEDLERTTGYKLSDNALAAWRQLEKIDSDMAEAGIANSGIENQAEDEALRDYRERNRQVRETTESTLKSKEASVAQASYSPAQIKAMNDEDSAKGLPRDQWRSVQWGLAPKDSVNLNDFIAQHRATYPNTTLTDDEIKAKYYDNLYDENGNYRSKLYQNYQDNKSKTIYGFNLSDIPSVSKTETQGNIKLNQKLDEEEKQQRDMNANQFGDQSKNFVDFSRPGVVLPETKSSLITPPKPKEVTPPVNSGVNSAQGDVYSGNKIATQYDPKTNKTSVIKPGERFQSGYKLAAGNLNSSNPNLTGRYQIKDLQEMGKYKPNQYEKISGNVYLKQGVKQLQ